MAQKVPNQSSEPSELHTMFLPLLFLKSLSVSPWPWYSCILEFYGAIFCPLGRSIMGEEGHQARPNCLRGSVKCLPSPTQKTNFLVGFHPYPILECPKRCGHGFLLLHNTQRVEGNPHFKKCYLFVVAFEKWKKIWEIKPFITGLTDPIHHSYSFWLSLSSHAKMLDFR